LYWRFAISFGSKMVPTEGLLFAAPSWRHVKKKLFTKEDHFHFHKIFGTFAILNFIHRYSAVYWSNGNLDVTGTVRDWVMMLALIAVPIVALQFDVPAKRMMKKPMVIWEEYRLHAIVFSLRGFSVFLFGLFTPDVSYKWLLQFLFIMGHHLVVDEITRRHGSPGHTTVRVQNEHIREELTVTKAIKRSYSLYQFLALASHLLPSEYTSEAGFNAFVAVHSSAFLMTLYRKRVIRGRCHFLVYTLCLMLSVYHIIRMFPEKIFLASVLLGFLLRVKFRLSKYAIWFGFCLMHSPLVKPSITEAFDGTYLDSTITSRFIWASILPLFSLYYYCYTHYVYNSLPSSPLKSLKVFQDMAMSFF